MQRRSIFVVVLALIAAAASGRVGGSAWGRGGGAAEAGRIWVCTNPDCEPYRYDPRRGDPLPLVRPNQPIPPGTRFEDLPQDWRCPVCGAPKADFEPDRRSNAGSS